MQLIFLLLFVENKILYGNINPTPMASLESRLFQSI